jgi:hypothetical protein
MTQRSKVLRKILKIGSSRAVTLPPIDWLEKTDYVWIKLEDSRIVVERAEVI